MTTPTPGWYPDPSGAADLRWWDGGGWTDVTAELPAVDPEPAAPIADDVAFVATTEAESHAVGEPEPVVESEPAAEPEPAVESEPAAVEPEQRPFSFRARPMELEPEVVELEAAIVVAHPAYESPLNAMKSPVAPRVAPVGPPPLEPTPEPEPEPEPEPVVVAVPAVPAEVQEERRPRRPSRRTAVGTAAVVVAAAGAAGATNLLHGEDPASPAGGKAPRPAPVAAAAADASCLKEWNTATSGDAAQLRVTLGQFTGALARVQRVSPLAGTLMQPGSCGLTVYDPATDAHAVFVSGLKGQVGYLDVTSYPRASKYGWPTTESQANVVIRPDGSLRAAPAAPRSGR